MHNTVLENVETWETARIMYMLFHFNKVTNEERKLVCLLAKDLTKIREELGDQVTTPLQQKFHRQLQLVRLWWFLTHALRVRKTGCWPLTLGWRVQMLRTTSLH